MVSFSFSFGCLTINSNRNQLCGAITLVTQLQGPAICFRFFWLFFFPFKHPAQYSLKSCPALSFICFRLQLLSQAAPPGLPYNCVCVSAFRTFPEGNVPLTSRL